MDFCPDCGGLMVPTKKERKLMLMCSSCGKTSQMQEETKIKEVVESGNDNEVELVDSSAEYDTLPLTDTECPECKHTKAYYWTVQTRAGDEPETKFLKCEKCKHVWRDYS